MGEIVSGALGAFGAIKSAKTQAKAADKATAAQNYRFDQMRTDLSPYRSAGTAATNRLQYLLGLSDPGMNPAYSMDTLVSNETGTPRPNDQLYASDPEYRKAWDAELARYENKFNRVGKGYLEGSPTEGLSGDLYARLRGVGPTAAANTDGQFGSLLKAYDGASLANDPGYKFELAQGNQALDRRMAAGGNYFSGGALKAAQRFGQDYAGTKFNEGFNRDNTTKSRAMNFLSSVANLGQTAATQTGQAGMAAGNRAADNIIGSANASAAGTVGAFNALSGGINNYYNNQNQQAMIDALKGTTSNNSLYTAMNNGSWGVSNGSDSWG